MGFLVEDVFDIERYLAEADEEERRKGMNPFICTNNCVAKLYAYNIHLCFLLAISGIETKKLTNPAETKLFLCFVFCFFFFRGNNRTVTAPNTRANDEALNCTGSFKNHINRCNKHSTYRDKHKYKQK